MLYIAIFSVEAGVDWGSIFGVEAGVDCRALYSVLRHEWTAGLYIQC